MIDFDAFGDPWEHLRLLSDAGRNQSLLELLSRRAPGARVAEVGCGAGIFSCVAAAMGATHVYAIEPSPMHLLARQLIEHNHLSERVTLLPHPIQEATPPPGGIDLIFSELLNVDPLSEEILEAMQAAERWRAPNGHLAPSRLRLMIALSGLRESANEVDAAQRQLQEIGQQTSLSFAPFLEAIQGIDSYRFAAEATQLLSAPHTVCEIQLGAEESPESINTITITANTDGAAGGVVIWFEADYDDGIQINNAPGAGGHWGQMICGWPLTRPIKANQAIDVEVLIEDGEILSPPPSSSLHTFSRSSS